MVRSVAGLGAKRKLQGVFRGKGWLWGSKKITESRTLDRDTEFSLYQSLKDLPSLRTFHKKKGGTYANGSGV